jgi:hypothetical protein
MSSDFEKELETRIDAELGALGDLTAPATLAPRVMRTLEQRAMRPWYRQSWSTWPRGLQWASFLSLLAMFTALVTSAWVLADSSAGQGSAALVEGWLKGAEVVLKVIEVLQTALVLSAQHLGTWVLAGCLALMAAMWVACIGLGTVYVRLGMQPAVNRN